MHNQSDDELSLALSNCDLETLERESKTSQKVRVFLKHNPWIRNQALARKQEGCPVSRPLLQLAEKQRQPTPCKRETIPFTARIELPMRSPLQGHTTHPVVELAILPNNELLSSCVGKLNTKIWDRLTGTCTRTLERPLSDNRALPGNQRISTSSDGNITISDTLTGAWKRTLVGHKNWVCSHASLPENRLASGSQDQTIKIWNITTGACERTLEGHTNSVHSLAPLPGNRLASGSQDQTIKIWGLASGQCVQTIHCDRAVSSLVYDQGALYAGLCNGQILRFDFAQIELDAEDNQYLEDIQKDIPVVEVKTSRAGCSIS